MSAVAELHKKKRRQNVACDTCKLRRVRCDLAEQIDPSLTTFSSLTDVPQLPNPSLQDLVLARPEVECTNCKNKNIKCTTVQILNPKKPNRGGKRIEEAKEKFGTGQRGEELGLKARNELGNGQPGETTPETALKSIPGDFLPAQAVDQRSWTVQPQQLSASYLSIPTGPLSAVIDPPWDPSLFERQTDVSLPIIGSSTPSYMYHFAPGYQNISEIPSAPSVKTDNVIISNDDPLCIYPNRLIGKDKEAAPVWNELLNRQNSVPHIYPMETHEAGPGFRTEDRPTLSNASTPLSSSSSFMPEVQFDALSMTLVPKEKPIPAPTTQFEPSRLAPTKPSSLYFRFGTSKALNDAVIGHKRARTDHDIESTSDNPWRLWEDDDVDEATKRRMMKWSRRNTVQEQLADRALGVELCRTLVKSFFNCVHPSLPALSPEGFYLEWEKAGQRSDMMTPAQEALCTVMEAWGARYSDCPVILGLPPTKYAMAPKVVQPDGTLAPGTQARAHWGRARLNVCNALVDRARRLIDINGLIRAPTVTGLQALLLYNQLLSLTDQRSRAADQYVENIMIQSAVVEQMRILQLMWDSRGEIPSEPEEIHATPGQLRMKQRIFWTVIISDAFHAAASGDLPRIPDEQLESVSKWISDVEARLPLSTFKTLAFFLSCYHRIALVARTVARRITCPNKKPGTVDVGYFSATLRECWAKIKSIHNDIVIITAEMLPHCEHSLIGFSPLSYIINLRLSCPFLLLVMQQALGEQLNFRKTVKESYIHEETPSSRSGTGSSQSTPGPSDPNVMLLEGLHLQSVDNLLETCRNQMYMYRVILPTGLVQTAPIFLRVLMASAQFLAEVPTVEQGYPAQTPGGYNWTWKTKQQEVKLCVEALHQLGWAWADVSEALDSISASMGRMTPSAEALEGYQAKAQLYDEQTVVAKEIAESNDKRLFSRAMGLWPPPSVPTVIEDAMKNLRLTESAKLDLTSPAVPWEELKAIRNSSQGNHIPDDVMRSPLSDSLAKMGKMDHDLAMAANMPLESRHGQHRTELPVKGHTVGGGSDTVHGPSAGWLSSPRIDITMLPSYHSANSLSVSSSQEEQFPNQLFSSDWMGELENVTQQGGFWVNNLPASAQETYGASGVHTEFEDHLWQPTPESVEELLQSFIQG